MSLTLERALYQKSHLYFLAFFACMLAAFWYTYFTRLFQQETWRQHAHGIALILWCLMLVGQPLLIRAKQFAWHRRVGRGSYVLVPILCITTLDLLKYRLAAAPRLERRPLRVRGPGHQLAGRVRHPLRVGDLVPQAAGDPRQVHGGDDLPDVHARDGPHHLHLLAVAGAPPAAHRGQPNVPLVGFFMADAMLVGLSLWDWVSHKRWNVFPFALVVLLAYHWSFLYGYQFAAWQRFCAWFVATVTSMCP